jgi:hypothetical protein
MEKLKRDLKQKAQEHRNLSLMAHSFLTLKKQSLKNKDKRRFNHQLEQVYFRNLLARCVQGWREFCVAHRELTWKRAKMTDAIQKVALYETKKLAFNALRVGILRQQ